MKTIKFKEEEIKSLIDTFELLNYMADGCKETKKYNNKFLRKFRKALL